jgi:hypothetical protein
VYELVVRHFLACCSKDAVGQETVMEIDIAGEAFRTTGGLGGMAGAGCGGRLSSRAGAPVPQRTPGLFLPPSTLLFAPTCGPQRSPTPHPPTTPQGLMVTERNWLDVYPYQNWGGNANLPPLVEGQAFTPTELLLKEVRKGPCPPSRPAPPTLATPRVASDSQSPGRISRPLSVPPSRPAALLSNNPPPR